MTTLIQFAALAVLAAMTAYICLLLYNGVRASQLSTGIADSERHLLQSRVAEIIRNEQPQTVIGWGVETAIIIAAARVLTRLAACVSA